MHDAFTPAKTVTYMFIHRSTNSQIHIHTLTHIWPPQIGKHTHTHAISCVEDAVLAQTPVVIATG